MSSAGCDAVESRLVGAPCCTGCGCDRNRDVHPPCPSLVLVNAATTSYCRALSLGQVSFALNSRCHVTLASSALSLLCGRQSNRSAYSKQKATLLLPCSSLLYTSEPSGHACSRNVAYMWAHRL